MQVFSVRQLTAMLMAVGLLNTGLWLDSLDNYLEARYQWRLSSQLPMSWFEPSRRLALLWSGQQADPAQTPTLTAEWKAPPPMDLSLQAQAHGEYWPTLAVQKLAAGPQHVLFAGDSMMQGIAPLVMRELSQTHPDWQMTDLSKQSTGLTSRKYFDWPLNIRQAIDNRGVTVVVIFLGPNDPRDMYLPTHRVSFGQPEWLENYAARVDEILAHAVQKQVRVIWVGLPSMRDELLQRGAAVSNQVFHNRAQAFGTDYLSTEPLIGIVSMPFQKYLREENGQQLNLRSEDGTHFTAIGLHKIKQALVTHIEKAFQP